MPAGLGTLFVGLLLIVLAFVEGDSVWKSAHQILFGLFGCGSFVLGAAVCYLAILYTRGQDLLMQVFKLLLGLIYANGVEVPQDDVQAASWFKRSSALSRTGYAEYWAGMLFRQGEKGFITPNKQKALYWLNLSCTEGFDTGCEEFDALSGE